MALLPYLMDMELHPRRLRDQFFGLDLSHDDFLTDVLARPKIHMQHLRPWRNLAAAARDLGSTIKSDKDKFQVNVDVQHFAPEEITVKAVDGHVVVEGKHEEKKDDHGYISREFKRRYALPEDCNVDAIESKLSSDGVLTVVCPKAQALKGERAIPITHTGPVRRKLKEDEEINDDVTNGEVVEETKTPQKKRRR